MLQTDHDLIGRDEFFFADRAIPPSRSVARAVTGEIRQHGLRGPVPEATWNPWTDPEARNRNGRPVLVSVEGGLTYEICRPANLIGLTGGIRDTAAAASRRNKKSVGNGRPEFRVDGVRSGN